MLVPEGGEKPAAGCPMHYQGFESAPSTRELVRMVASDPSDHVPVWEEASLDNVPQAWPEDDPEAENHLLAIRSELHALTGLVVNDFAHELARKREANPPLGLRKGFGGQPKVPVEIEDAEPTLSWVVGAINEAAFQYSGEHLAGLRQPEHPYKPAIDRLDSIIASTFRRPDLGPGSTPIERDELQIFINGGMRTSTGVNELFLGQIERLVRSEVPDVDAATIADTAHRSYRLPLQLARLSLGTVLTYSQLLKKTQPLVLVEENDGYRAAFSAPPNELFKKVLGADLEHPTVLGCPANVKIGKRMIDEVWHWFIDIAEEVKVWDNQAAFEAVA